MKRLFIIVMLGCCSFLLVSCHTDEKQANKIYEKLEKSTSYEKEFASNQEDLENYKEKEQSIYEDLIDLDVEETDIQQKLEDANVYIEKQRQLVETAEDNYQKAYKESVSIKKNAKEIKSKKQQAQVSKLLAVIKERGKLMVTFFDDYDKQIKDLTSFYSHLEDDDIPLDKLDNQISDINERNQDLQDETETFNQYTKQYNDMEKHYYQTAE